jgi:flagellar biosynthetic protein FliR
MSLDLSAFLTAQVLEYALIFARIGAVAMFMPGIGESFFPIRHRLALALVLSFALAPVIPPTPASLDDPLRLFAVFGIEVTLGLWIGLTARILLTSLQFAGYQIGLISGLSNAFAPDMGSFQGSTLIATALMLGGVALIFATDLHHQIIAALLMSYDVFPPGLMMPGDLAHEIVRAVSMSVYIGLSITAPFYVMGVVLNVGLGLSNRMMPTLPVFFVAAPVLIAAGLFVLVVAAPAMLRGFLTSFEDWLGHLVF